MGRGGMNTRFWRESQQERNHYEDIKMDLTETGWREGMAWIHLAQDKGQWRALGNTLMDLWVP
jgi:hypothetical protein